MEEELRVCAELLGRIEQVRFQLMALAVSEGVTTKRGKRCLKLSTMIEQESKSMKERFTQITLEEV